MYLFRFELANGPTGVTGNLFQREHFNWRDNAANEREMHF
jgi:hypothetical protein